MKVYFSYAHVHAAMSSLAEKIRAWNPDVMVAIGGGGFIPARMLRTEIKVPGSPGLPPFEVKSPLCAALLEPP